MKGNNNRVFRTLCLAGAALLAQTASSEPPKAEQPRATSAPASDRIGFPTDYRTRYKKLGVTVRPIAPEVLTVYVNEPAASVASREKLPFPEGSIILMEFSFAVKDANNQPQRDSNGNVQIRSVDHVDVMKRGKNFGEAYGESRAGEWEFAGYRLDGTYSTAPQDSAQCAACHRGAGPENDFVFRMRAPAATM